MVKNIQLVTGRDEHDQLANVGTGIDDNGLLVLISPGADLTTGAQQLREMLWSVIEEECGPATDQARALITSKLHNAVVDHFMKLGSRETRLDPDTAFAYQKLVRAANSA